MQISAAPLARLAPGVILGPAMRVGAREVFYIRSVNPERFARLGTRERHLLSAVLGNATLEDASSWLADRGVTLKSADSLRKFMTEMARRGYFADANDTPAAKALHSTARQAIRLDVRKWHEIYVKIVSVPNNAIKAAPGYRLTVTFGLLVALAIGAFEFSFLTHLSLLAARFRAQFHASDVLPLLVYGVFSSVIHEFAHALVYRAFGGNLPEIGVMFRYLMVLPYCRLNDLVVMHSRLGRMCTVLAGPAASLLLVGLIYVLYMTVNEPPAVQRVSLLIIIVYHPAEFLNLVPFLRFDGYYLVSVCVGRPELREESQAALSAILRRKILSQANWWLIAYGIASTLITVAVVVVMAARWSVMFGPRLGVAVGCLGLLILAGKGVSDRSWTKLIPTRS